MVGSSIQLVELQLEGWREAIIKGIMAEVVPGNILANMCKINFSIVEDLKTWTLEPDRFGVDHGSITCNLRS